MRKAFAALAVAALALVVPAARAEAANTEIHIINGAPRPDQAQVVVNEGDTVSFANDDDVPHAIFAAGVQRGDTIPAHTTSGPYGPFFTGGQGGTFDYQVDRDGAPGRIIVAGPAPTEPPPTQPPATTAPPTTAATTTTSTNTTTSTTTTTTSTTTTTTVASSSSSSPSSSSSSGSSSKDTNSSSSGLAVLGVALLVAGFGGMVIATTRRRGP